MNDTLFFALTAGMVAAFNPCGFALLPAYLALLLSRTDTQRAPVGRALAASAATIFQGKALDVVVVSTACIGVE